MMKRVFLGASLLFVSTALLAQQPMDEHHQAASPAETASATIGGKTLTISYSSPRVRGRQGHIFSKDGLISHDQDYPYWRGGANAATTFKTSGNISIGDLNVPAGAYTLFVDISNPGQWTLVVSKETGQWGLNYSQGKDLGRVKMTMAKPPAMVEALKYTIRDDGGSKGTITLAWENESASVPVHVH